MKRIFTLIAMAAIALQIQAQDLPRPSPAAKVEQRVGLTDISMTYSRPGAKGRTVWGDLVPYGKMWRAGANKATMLSLSGSASFNGSNLEAGDYSFFIIPEESGQWMVVINRNTELWGTGEYDESMDVARFEADVRETANSNERMEFRFTQVDIGTAELVMDWAGMQVAINIECDPMEQVMQNIETSLADSEEGEKWKVYRTAASFAKDANLTTQGINWIQQSIELKDSWYSYWIYADLLAQKKDYKGAISQAKKSIKLGAADYKERGKDFTYQVDLEEEIKGWEGKM